MASTDEIPRQEFSIQQCLVSHLQQVINQRAVVWDVSTAGSEEVILVLDIGGDTLSSPADSDSGKFPDINQSKTNTSPVLNHLFTGRAALHLLLLSPVPLAWLEPTSRKKPLPPSGFGRWLKSKIQGAKVTAVSSGESGRIIALNFETSTTEQTSLVLDPLSNACRLLILAPDKTVEQRYPAPIHASASGRGTPGAVFTEPVSEAPESWQRWLQISSADSGQKSKATSSNIKDADQTLLWLCKRQTNGGSVRTLSGIPLFISPIANPEFLEADISIYSTPHTPLAAARRMGRTLIATERLYESRRRMSQTLRSERKHQNRLLKRINQEIVDAREGASLRRQAESLLINTSAIPRGLSQCELPDATDPDQILLIKLDPARSVSDNATRLFKQAGRMERALATREKKAEQIKHLLEFIESELITLETPLWPDLERDPFPLEASSLKSIIQSARTHNTDLDPGLHRRWSNLVNNLRSAYDCLTTPTEHTGYEARRSGAPTASGKAGSKKSKSVKSSGPKPEHWGPTDSAAEKAGIHPRRYILPGGWVVLVGRTNTENDKLSHKAARQRDLWFHARGVAGSHIVLQRGNHKDNPSQEILELTAAIAAWYSKAKTSRIAPVMYTEKRYVRKPRKSPPGLAVCIREKVLMVEPGLPHQSGE